MRSPGSSSCGVRLSRPRRRIHAVTEIPNRCSSSCPRESKVSLGGAWYPHGRDTFLMPISSGSAVDDYQLLIRLAFRQRSRNLPFLLLGRHVLTVVCPNYRTPAPTLRPPLSTAWEAFRWLWYIPSHCQLSLALSPATGCRARGWNFYGSCELSPAPQRHSR